jgi:hypothetical protein
MCTSLNTIHKQADHQHNAYQYFSVTRAAAVQLQYVYIHCTFLSVLLILHYTLRNVQYNILRNVQGYRVSQWYTEKCTDIYCTILYR